jgi:hypothetical protein
MAVEMTGRGPRRGGAPTGLLCRKGDVHAPGGFNLGHTERLEKIPYATQRGFVKPSSFLQHSLTR